MTAQLIRVVEDNRAEGFEQCCVDGQDCESTPRFVVATPLGEMGFCDEHVSEIIALLPQDWIDQWSRRESFVVTRDSTIPF